MAPDNQRVRLYTRIRDGVFEDGADQLSFRVNQSLEAVHRSLSTFYRATDGDNWKRNGQLGHHEGSDRGRTGDLAWCLAQ